MWFSIFCIGAAIAGMLIFRGYKKEIQKDLKKYPEIIGILCGMALFMTDIYRRVIFFLKKGHSCPEHDSLKDQLSRLSPLEDMRLLEYRYYVKKMQGLAIICILIGIFSAVAGTAAAATCLIDDGIIIRNEPGEGKKRIRLYAEADEKGHSEMEIMISPRIYGEEEREEIFAAAQQYIKQQALGENEDWGHIQTSLNLMDTVPGTDMTVDWITGDAMLMDSSGNIIKENIQRGGEALSITAKINYAGEIREFKIPMMIYPKAAEENFFDILEKQIEEENLKNPERKEVILPQEISGIPIVWSEPKQHTEIKIIGIGIIVLAVYAASGISKNKELLKKRSEQLMKDYPELVHKLVLLGYAGVNFKPALSIIIKDARASGCADHYVWQEIEAALRAMEQGVSEVQAYEMLGRRCAQLPYLKLTTMMIQSLKKGVGGIQQMMSETADEAMMMKREQAKNEGEKVGTKLLMPMGIMLAVVLVILVVPAFLTINI